MHADVLIAGAGDVGLRAARRFVGHGHRVFALRRHPPGEAPPGVTWLRGDLTDPASLAGLPGAGIVVFAPTPGAREEAAYRAVFVDGLRHVLAALPAPPARLVFASSSAVYGEHGGAWIDETTPTAPPGFNGRVLLEAEGIVSRLPGGIAVRLAGLYGPGRTQLLDRLREGKAGVPHGQGIHANRIHVDDAAAALVHVALLDEPAPLYIGVDDTPLPIDVLYGQLARLVDGPAPPDGPAPAGVGNKRLSNARLRASGFACQWPDAREGYAALLGSP